MTETMTCPIGGGRFEFTSTVSYSTYGSRPDGKPYGSWTFPLALPDCPDNGLVVYKAFTANEIERLRPIVASAAYQALRVETPYYRAHWLMKEMGAPPSQYLWTLLQAAWEADDKPQMRSRYLAELARMSALVPANPADVNWVGMEVRSANALRELGRFDEALARLNAIPTAPLRVAVPSGGSPELAEQAENRREWLDYIKKLRRVIERKDSDMEPFDLIPRDEAINKCIDPEGTLSAHMAGFCAREARDVEAERRRMRRAG